MIPALANKSGDIVDFVVTLAAIGLVRGAAMLLYSYFPQHNSPMYSLSLLTEALLLLVVPQMSTMSSDLPASENPLFIS